MQGIVAMKANKVQFPLSSTPVFLYTRNVRKSSLHPSPAREYHPEEPIRDVRAHQESCPKYLPKRDHEGVLCATRPRWRWFDRHRGHFDNTSRVNISLRSFVKNTCLHPLFLLSTEWPHAPGIWDEKQVSGWKNITDAVHNAGGKIYAHVS